MNLPMRSYKLSLGLVGPPFSRASQCHMVLLCGIYYGTQQTLVKVNVHSSDVER